MTATTDADSLKDAFALLRSYMNGDFEACAAIVSAQKTTDGRTEGGQLLIGLLRAAASLTASYAELLGAPADLVLAACQQAGIAVGDFLIAAEQAAAAEHAPGTEVPLADLPPLTTTDETKEGDL